MPEEPLNAHSLAEAYLFLMATPCETCTQGPVESVSVRSIDSSSSATLAILARCTRCGAESTLSFQFADECRSQKESTLNPTDEPSRILDVGQWVMLYHMILETASREENSIQSRTLKIEAAQCLTEALRFYDDPANDLPPAEAFFNDASSERFRDAPHQFSKTRLLSLRAKLPTPSPRPKGD